LQLRGVDGSHHAIPLALEMLASANPIQCVARSDLCPAAPVHQLSGAPWRRPPRGGALGTKPLESKGVDRFERQRGLKSLDRCRVEITRELQRPLAIETSAVALEAERTCRMRTGCARVKPAIQSHLLQSLAARRTQCLRAFALELAPREASPLVLSNLRGFG
jgi:hypothetical protein